MSARLLRRILKEQEEEQQRLGSSRPDLDGRVGGGEEEEEEEPDSPGNAVGAPPSRNLFDLLGDQEDEQEVPSIDSQEDSAEQGQPAARVFSDTIPVSNRKSKKKKKKSNKDQRTAGKGEESIDLILEDLSISDKHPTAQSGSESSKPACNEVHANIKKHSSSTILMVDPKHLKAENELRKIFGSKVVNSFENSLGGGSSRQLHSGRRATYNLRKTILASPPGYWPRWDGSISMQHLESKDGMHYFRYVHSTPYSRIQEAFEAAKATNDLNAIASILAHHPYHIDSLLTFAEVFKFSGEHQSSADAIGKCLYALECAWHPLFTPLKGNCQLKYSHDTNKPLFSALFSHMISMDRRGCHRSALEVCKLLLSLDPDDPKGALFCIDYFSLRAQEYSWLEQFAEEFRRDTSLWLFPSFSYSLAICRFYIERDSAVTDGNLQAEKSSSADLMKQALMLHPLVLQKLVSKAPLKDSIWTQILKHPFFGSAKAGSPTLEHLIDIYVERNYIMWRYPDLQNLLKEAALLVIETHKQNSSEAKDWACVRKEAFSSEKNEYSHLLVSDFSDTAPSLPPEEIRPFMIAPHMGHEVPAGEIDQAVPERARAPREVAGRNAAVVFLESLLPWIDYGQNGNGHPDDHGENVD